MGRGKVSALDKGFQKLQKNKVIIHKIAKEIFNKNQLDKGSEGKDHIHTHRHVHISHTHDVLISHIHTQKLCTDSTTHISYIHKKAHTTHLLIQSQTHRHIQVMLPT